MKWPFQGAPKEKPAREPHWWLLSIPAYATLFAAGVEIYWAVLFCIQATGFITLSWNAGATSAGVHHNDWELGFAAHWPVLIGLAAAAVPIVAWSMIWLPAQMMARGTGKWRRITMGVAGVLANLLVIVSGTVVMNGNRQEQVRGAVVKEEAAAQNVAALRAIAEAKKAELGDVSVPGSLRPTYQQQACRVGSAAWRIRVATAQTQGDVQYPAIARAVADAIHCDQLRNEYRQALTSVYAAPTVAATAANVEDNVGAGLNHFAQYADAYRPPFVALVCTLIGILGPFWLVGLHEKRRRESNLSDEAFASGALMIADQTAADPIASNPAFVDTHMFDTETGERFTMVKPHKRAIKKKKGGLQTAEVDIPGVALPDETQVTSPSDRREVSAWAASEMPTEEKHDVDRVADSDPVLVPALGGAGARVGGDVDVPEVGDEGAAGDAVEAEQPVVEVAEIPTSEFTARLKAGTVDLRGFETADYGEAFGPHVYDDRDEAVDQSALTDETAKYPMLTGPVKEEV